MHTAKRRAGAKPTPMDQGKELGRATFGGRAVRLSRAGRGITLLEVVTLDRGRLTGVICGLRLTLDQLNELADVVDEVATDVEEADGLDEGARDHERRAG